MNTWSRRENGFSPLLFPWVSALAPSAQHSWCWPWLTRLFLAPASFLPMFSSICGALKMQNKGWNGKPTFGRGRSFPFFMDKPEFPFVFQSLLCLLSEKPTKPGQFRTRKLLPGLENFLFINWDTLNYNNWFYLDQCSCFFRHRTFLHSILTQGLEGLTHFNPSFANPGGLAILD